jgi:hypothetical protein
MTKAKMNENADGKPAAAKPAKAAAAKARLHLRSVRSEQAADGSIVHHHTYADTKDARYPHPERMNMATSTSPEEAGQHVTEMFGQNGQGEPDGDEGAQPAPAAQPQSAAPPEE